MTAPTQGRHAVTSGRRRIIGVGSAYPGEPVSSQALCERIEKHFGINTQRHAKLLAPKLGVNYRYLCRDFVKAQESPRQGARNPELAASALKLALKRAELTPNMLGYLISHTATPATLIPAGSAEIARLLDYDGPHAELRQACTGFANALQFAFALTSTANAAPVAIVGVETGSVYFDPRSLQTDPSQWINFLQMGDGAAAIIIAPENANLKNTAPRPYISSAYFGQLQNAPAPSLSLSSGGSDCATPPTGTLLFNHDFSAVAKHGAQLLDAGRAILTEAGFDINEAEMLVPHQASGAVAPWLAKYWGLDEARISTHAQRVGNLGSASIWAALDDVLQSKPADINDNNKHLFNQPSSNKPLLFFGAEATQYSYGGFAIER